MNLKVLFGIVSKVDPDRVIHIKWKDTHCRQGEVSRV